MKPEYLNYYQCKNEFSNLIHFSYSTLAPNLTMIEKGQKR